MGDEREEYQQQSAHQRSSAKHVDADGEHDQKRARNASKAALDATSLQRASEDETIRAIDRDADLLAKEFFEFKHYIAKDRDLTESDGRGEAGFEPIIATYQARIDVLVQQAEALGILMARVKTKGFVEAPIAHLDGTFSDFYKLLQAKANKLNALNASGGKIDTSVLRLKVTHMYEAAGLERPVDSSRKVFSLEPEGTLAANQNAAALGQLSAMKANIESIRAGNGMDGGLVYRNADAIVAFSAGNPKIFHDRAMKKLLDEVRSGLAAIVRDPQSSSADVNNCTHALEKLKGL